MHGPGGNEVSYSKLKKDVRRLADDITEYSESAKQELGQALSLHIAALHQKAEQLKQRTTELEGAAFDQLNQLARQIEIKLEMFSTKLSATQALSGEVWLEWKAGLIQAWSTMTSKIESELQKLQDNDESE